MTERTDETAETRDELKDRIAAREQQLTAEKQRDPEAEFAEKFRDALNASRTPWFGGE